MAQVFSDPPLNIVGIEKQNGSVQYAGGIQAPATGLYASLADGAYRVGFRAHQLEVANGKVGRHAFHATVTVTEITGSESFVHLTATPPTGSRCCRVCMNTSRAMCSMPCSIPTMYSCSTPPTVWSPRRNVAFSSEVRSASREENASKNKRT